jgi:hypothetical protein
MTINMPYIKLLYYEEYFLEYQLQFDSLSPGRPSADGEEIPISELKFNKDGSKYIKLNNYEN